MEKMMTQKKILNIKFSFFYDFLMFIGIYKSQSIFWLGSGRDEAKTFGFFLLAIGFSYFLTEAYP
jgi:hypothetical protein